MWLIFFAFFLSNYLMASEIMTSADTLRPNRISFDIYWTSFKQRMKIRQEITSNITVTDPITKRKFNYLSDTTSETEVDTVISGTVFKATFQPSLKINIYTKFGIIGSGLRQSVPSGRNEWSSDFSGYICGGGVKLNLLQNTMVSPAICFDLGITGFDSTLKRLNVVGSSTQDIDLDIGAICLEPSFSVSKKIKNFEPYGGVKFYYLVYGEVFDRPTQTSGDLIGGGVSGYIGFKVKVPGYEFLRIIGEGSFGSEFHLGAGLGFNL